MLIQILGCVLKWPGIMSPCYVVAMVTHGCHSDIDSPASLWLLCIVVSIEGVEEHDHIIILYNKYSCVYIKVDYVECCMLYPSPSLIRTLRPLSPHS